MSVLSSQDLSNLSRFLIKILRHKALDYNLDIDSNGFIKCSEILSLPNLKNVKIEDILQIVESCNKKRYTIKLVDRKYYIAANQGHSMKIKSDLLKPITLENYHNYENKDIIHGSFLRAKKLNIRTRA